MSSPTWQEQVAFLEARAREGGVRYEPGALRDLVTRRAGRFRQCLEELADAARRADRTLFRPRTGGSTPNPAADPGEFRGSNTPAPASPFTDNGW